jgi:hypothetical protein
VGEWMDGCICTFVSDAYTPRKANVLLAYVPIMFYRVGAGKER